MMMMDPNKKSLASVIVGKLRGDGSAEMSGGDQPEVDASAGKNAAARKLMDAMKSGDEVRAASALSEFIDMHMAEEEGGGPEEADALPSA